MRWWIVSILFICPLFTSLSLPLLGARQESISSGWLTLLHLTDCELPCWIGITPGETTIGEAQDWITTTYGDTSLYSLDTQGYSSVVTYKPTGYQLNIGFHSDAGAMTENSIVRRIYLAPFIRLGESISRLMLFDVQNILGMPIAVRLATGVENPTVVLIYSDQRVSVVVDDLDCDKVLPDQQVKTIVLDDQVATNDAWLSDPQEWRGFGYCYNFERKLS